MNKNIRRFGLQRHTQAAEEAIPHLCKQERKRPIPVRKGQSRIDAVLGRVIPEEWVPVTGMRMWSLAGLSAHCAVRMLLLSDELMSCCAAGANGCLDLRRHAFALDGQVRAEWSRCPGSMAGSAKDSVAPLRRSSAG